LGTLEISLFVLQRAYPYTSASCTFLEILVITESANWKVCGEWPFFGNSWVAKNVSASHSRGCSSRM